jgi:hypothetical protein
MRELANGWTHSSSLREVLFESALSLRVMIETGNIDLSDSFEIKLIDCDCFLDFPGYSVETVHDANANDLVRLVKISRPA